MSISASQKKQFQTKILSWYEKHKRDLPWRKTRDPYRILVSEVMLQQTQVSRVIPKYEAWLKRFPTIETLAKASTADVLRAWSGLGYNRRALYLKRIAEVISIQYKGIWPRTIKELTLLPGVGEYTARALLCFAFDEQLAVVDTNVKKVIKITFLQMAYGKWQRVYPEKEIQQIADQLLPKGRAYEWNQALMDYAAAVMKKHKIPIPKQSTFQGSNRYYRGKIIQLLTKEHGVHKNFLQKKLQIDEEKLLKILEKLKKDGLIAQQGNTYSLPS